MEVALLDLMGGAFTGEHPAGDGDTRFKVVRVGQGLKVVVNSSASV